MSKSVSRLSDAEIKEIKDMASSDLMTYEKPYDTIGTLVFDILELNARMIYYPLGDEAPWGFTRIVGSAGDSSASRPFVVINASIPIDCQVFAAAHELYHILHDSTVDVVPASILTEQPDKPINEVKASRFAAEFLVQETLLTREIKLHQIDKRQLSMRDVLKLAEIFCVPYRAMVKRLSETGIIDRKKTEDFLFISEQNVSELRARFSIAQPQATNRVAIDNLVDLSARAYEAGAITYERLEYLLGLCQITPESVGISEPLHPDLPGDEELDAIAEEE